MSQPRFDQLRERLLHAGIAPRHVRRYIAELRDHFDDLVREETATGAAPALAQSKARARLGRDDALAQVMLARPGVLRSISARYPWAVFGLAPVALVVAALVGAVLIEAGVFDLVSALIHRPKSAGHPPPEWFTSIVFAWNWLATWAAPLAIAVALCAIGLRQRMPAAWIFTGITVACVLGAFQVLSWQDNGLHGELSLGSGLWPPFPLPLVVGGLYRALVTIAISAAIYWFAVRRQTLDSTRMTQTLAAE